MRYHLIFTDWFNRNLKSLRKRNARLRQDFQAFLNGFDAEAHPIISGTGGARKARMRAQGRGKQGGYRFGYENSDFSRVTLANGFTRACVGFSWSQSIW